MRSPYHSYKVDVSRGVPHPDWLYHGGVLRASAGGTATVAVYDGLDNTGVLIDYFRASTSDRDVHVLEAGLTLRVGLYVEIGSNVTAFTAFYSLASDA